MNREEVFYDKLKSEYEGFLEELEEYDAEDFMENAEYIAAIKEIYEYLERDKPVKTDEQLDYFLKLRNPLNRRSAQIYCSAIIRKRVIHPNEHRYCKKDSRTSCYCGGNA